MSKGHRIQQDLGSDRDGFGRPLTDPIAAASRLLCTGKGVEAQPPTVEGKEPQRSSEPIIQGAGGFSGEDVPVNKFVQRHREEGYELLSFRVADREQAKAEADKLRASGKKAVYVTLMMGRFGVLCKER